MIGEVAGQNIEVDLLEPQTFVAGVPHEAFARLRRRAPVHWHPGRPSRGELFPGRPEPDQRGFWIVSRHADVVTVSKDPATFSSARGSAVLADLPEDDLASFRDQLIHIDPPRHTKMRRVVSAGFRPQRIARMEGHVRDLARQVVDRVAPRGKCDFVAEVAAELPLLVLAELLGVPVEDRAKLFDWSNRLIGLEDPDLGSPVDARVASLEMIMYAADLFNKRQAEPRDDISSALVHGEIDGEKLTAQERCMFFFLLVVAGNETTRNAISGGMRALCEHPEQRRRLLADRSLLPVAVEEMIRWVTPVMQFRRTATRDTELAGQQIRENDKVALYYGSANRDAAAFDQPEVFDVARDPNPHVGFGIGAHFCLGSHLARIEMQLMFEEILRRMPDVEIDGPVERLRSNFINGIKRMPVRFSAESVR